MAAYGLYTHIQSNKRRSVALLIGLFFLVYVMVFAGALLAEGLTVNAPLDYLMRAAAYDWVKAAPFATVGAVVWVAIAYRFHQAMIDAVTGAHPVERNDEPRLYNLLENLCISRGIPMPTLRIAEDDALNAFATGLNPKQYSITVTRGLMNALNDQEMEAVLGHELTHIRNGDVRMMVIAMVIAGVISFFGEMVFRLFFQGGFYGGSRRSGGDGDRKGGAGIAILIAIVIIVVVWLLSVVIRFALSRQREYLADAGSVELTKNPDAMIMALRKIEGRGELHAATSAVMEMCVDNPRQGFSDIFRHPPFDRLAHCGNREICRRPRSRPARAGNGRAAAARGSIDGRPLGRSASRARATIGPVGAAAVARRAVTRHAVARSLGAGDPARAVGTAANVRVQS